METKQMTKEERVIKVFQHVVSNPVDISDSIKNDLGFDSLDFVEMLMFLEKEFGVFITDQEAEEWDTVGDVINFIEKNVQ